MADTKKNETWQFWIINIPFYTSYTAIVFIEYSIFFEVLQGMCEVLVL